MYKRQGTTGAARNDMPLQTRNIASALQAAELAAKLGCNTFVGAGSQAEYGRTEQLLSPETPVFPENGYGMAKLCAGQMSRIRCQELGIKHVWVRILSVYGPVSYTHLDVYKRQDADRRDKPAAARQPVSAMPRKRETERFIIIILLFI